MHSSINLFSAKSKSINEGIKSNSITNLHPETIMIQDENKKSIGNFTRLKQLKFRLENLINKRKETNKKKLNPHIIGDKRIQRFMLIDELAILLTKLENTLYGLENGISVFLSLYYSLNQKK